MGNGGSAAARVLTIDPLEALRAQHWREDAPSWKHGAGGSHEASPSLVGDLKLELPDGSQS
jgi:hypothetical protein